MNNLEILSQIKLGKRKYIILAISLNYLRTIVKAHGSKYIIFFGKTEPTEKNDC